MFNALNRFISRLDGDATPRGNYHDGRSSSSPGGFGFQVLRNSSPSLAIDPWFDFIVGINGRVIDDPTPHLFAQEVRNCAGGTVSLGLWSAKGQRTRVLHVAIPAATSEKQHPDASELLVGLGLQWTPLDMATNIWHVLDVAAKSPADAAGLLPYSDYIIGTPDGQLSHGESALGELVDDHVGRPLRLWVYNNEYDVTRELDITPSREWGGEGALGCVLGFGALHRLPAPLEEPVNAPGEMMFEGDGKAGTGLPPAAAAAAVAAAVPAMPMGDGAEGTSAPEFLVPAQMMQSTGPQPSGPPLSGPPLSGPPPPMGGGTPVRTKKKERQGPNRMMDDYFAEEEKKSRELDGPQRAAATPPPPPPKAGAGPPPPKGGPPRASSQPQARQEGEDEEEEEDSGGDDETE